MTRCAALGQSSLCFSQAKDDGPSDCGPHSACRSRCCEKCAIRCAIRAEAEARGARSSTDFGAAPPAARERAICAARYVVPANTPQCAAMRRRWRRPEESGPFAPVEAVGKDRIDRRQSPAKAGKGRPRIERQSAARLDSLPVLPKKRKRRSACESLESAVPLRSVHCRNRF